MYNYGFPDNEPIQEIIQSYLGINVSGEPVKKVLTDMAHMFDSRCKNFQPTYALHAKVNLKGKFDYLLERVFIFYKLEDREAEELEKFFWDLAFNLVAIKSKKNSPDYETKNLNLKSSENLKLENDSLPEVESVDRVSEVTLYKYADRSINIDSSAYFSKDDLVIDYWKLSGDHEDEYFVTVKKEHFEMLCSRLKIKNKSLLLTKLLNSFEGENCFENVKAFLSQNNIPFQIERRS